MWVPDTPEEWSAVAGTAAALVYGWKKYRGEKKSGGNEIMAVETCPAHQAVRERLEWGNERFKMLETNMNEVKTGIAVIVERLDHMKEVATTNRALVLDQYEELSRMLHKIKDKVEEE